MRDNKLGGTGLLVSELCFGTMTFGCVGAYAAIGTVAQATADALLARAIDAVSQLPPEYPGWMLAFWSQARAKQLDDADVPSAR